MRFRITLRVVRGSILPINYQYPLSAWIYKCINQADAGFAQLLHQQGYASEAGHKPFKFFTFSQLHVSRRQIYEDRLVIGSDTVSLTVGFLMEQAAETFITGIFMSQHAGIGDKKSQVDFEVVGIEALPVTISETMTFRTASPIVISKPIVRSNGQLTSQYLSPQDEGYADLFVKNLLNKYQHYYDYLGVDEPALSRPVSWELLGELPVRSRLITVKAHTQYQTKIKGYDYAFRLSAPEALMRIGVAAGFGEKNSMGMGMVSEYEDKRSSPSKSLAFHHQKTYESAHQ